MFIAALHGHKAVAYAHQLADPTRGMPPPDGAGRIGDVRHPEAVPRGCRGVRACARGRGSTRAPAPDAPRRSPPAVRPGNPGVNGASHLDVGQAAGGRDAVAEPGANDQIGAETGGGRRPGSPLPSGCHWQDPSRPPGPARRSTRHAGPWPGCPRPASSARYRLRAGSPGYGTGRRCGTRRTGGRCCRFRRLEDVVDAHSVVLPERAVLGGRHQERERIGGLPPEPGLADDRPERRAAGADDLRDVFVGPLAAAAGCRWCGGAGVAQVHGHQGARGIAAGAVPRVQDRHVSNDRPPGSPKPRCPPPPRRARGRSHLDPARAGPGTSQECNK